MKTKTVFFVLAFLSFIGVAIGQESGPLFTDLDKNKGKFVMVPALPSYKLNDITLKDSVYSGGAFILLNKRDQIMAVMGVINALKGEKRYKYLFKCLPPSLRYRDLADKLEAYYNYDAKRLQYAIATSLVVVAADICE